MIAALTRPFGFAAPSLSLSPLDASLMIDPMPAELDTSESFTAVTATSKSSDLSTLTKRSLSFSLLFTPNSVATATMSLTAPEFSEFSSRLSNISGVFKPSSSASAVTSTTSPKFPNKLDTNSSLDFSPSLFLRYLCEAFGFEIPSSPEVLSANRPPAALIASTATRAFSSVGLIMP